MRLDHALLSQSSFFFDFGLNPRRGDRRRHNESSIFGAGELFLSVQTFLSSLKIHPFNIYFLVSIKGILNIPSRISVDVRDSHLEVGHQVGVRTVPVVNVGNV